LKCFLKNHVNLLKCFHLTFVICDFQSDTIVYNLNFYLVFLLCSMYSFCGWRNPPSECNNLSLISGNLVLRIILLLVGVILVPSNIFLAWLVEFLFWVYHSILDLIWIILVHRTVLLFWLVESLSQNNILFWVQYSCSDWRNSCSVILLFCLVVSLFWLQYSCSGWQNHCSYCTT
jgi:hypothetical protein